MVEVVILVVVFADIERLLRDKGGDVFVGFLVCCRGRSWFPGLCACWRHFEEWAGKIDGWKKECRAWFLRVLCEIDAGIRLVTACDALKLFVAIHDVLNLLLKAMSPNSNAQ